jgi:hypothetical protein
VSPGPPGVRGGMTDTVVSAALGLVDAAYVRLQTQREREAVEVGEDRRAPPGRIERLKRWHSEAEGRAAELFEAIVGGEIEP